MESGPPLVPFIAACVIGISIAQIIEGELKRRGKWPKNRPTYYLSQLIAVPAILLALIIVEAITSIGDR